MGTQLPDLDYRTIYVQTPSGLSVGKRVRTRLMDFFMPTSDRAVHYISNDAKVNPSTGVPYNHFMRKLPEMNIAAMIVAAYQNQRPKATAQAQGFPYKLKATGLVDPVEIIRYQNTYNHFISNDVRVVP